MSLSRVTRSVTPARVRSGQTDFAYLKITGKEGRAIQKQVDALEAGKTAGIEPKPMQAGAREYPTEFLPQSRVSTSARLASLSRGKGSEQAGSLFIGPFKFHKQIAPRRNSPPI
jgi:hypothetical protein